MCRQTNSSKVIFMYLYLIYQLSCGVVWAKSALETHMGYIIFIYSFGFTIPLTIILISYTKLIKTIRLRVRIMYVIVAIKPPISFSKSNL